AKYHEKEAEIVAQAGKLGAVTISTNMAGRGTDIMLGGNPEYMAKAQMRKQEIPEELIAMATGTTEIDDENVKEARAIFAELYGKFKKEIEPEANKVREAGGLFILGTERHESRRIDNQLRGRSGRQGDPGESMFFLSLEDDLMRLFGSERILAIADTLKMPDDTPIDAKILSNSIERAQKNIEDTNFKRRKNVITYDDVMNQQRNIIYTQRRSVLDGDDMKETILKMISSTISDTVARYTVAEQPAEWDLSAIRADLSYICSEDDLKYTDEELARLKSEEISDALIEKANKMYEAQEALFTPEIFREVERTILLRNVDIKWMDHIDAMDDLKESIGLQAYAQRDPVNEYRIQGADMFDEMIADIRENTVRTVLTCMPRKEAIERKAVAKPILAGFAGNTVRKKTAKINNTVVKNEKVGRNDPCPCGSGKKYKKCCGANASDED
ncbi:MAG: SEC-C domain-containing protein, partial [Clostridia bacterium]|nr:SEC-C domain-containing protein [Clostridia bacterium]